MLDQQQDAESARPDTHPDSVLYRRPMPGGGYVEVELIRSSSVIGADARPHGRIIMERRSEFSRRAGHLPPVVVELVGQDEDALLSELVRLARDNAMLARHVMRWQAAGSHAG